MPDRFAFLVHPLTMEEMYNYDPGLRGKDYNWIKCFIRDNLPPSVVKSIEISSPNGKLIEGIIICIFLLPEQFLKESQAIVTKKVTKACRIAEKMGCKLIGLGAYTAVIGGGGEKVSKVINIPVTTGNSYTAITAVESAIKWTNIMDISLKESRLAIIGATGSIGTLCAKIMAERVSKITLIAPQLDRLKKLKEEIVTISNCVDIATDIGVIKDHNIIILTTSSPFHLIDIHDLNSNTLVINISQPPNIGIDKDREVSGVIVVESGLVSSPTLKKVSKVFDKNFPYVKGIDSENIHACLAESIVLTFENRYENFSIGRNIAISKAYEIFHLGKKYGFFA